MINLEKDSQDYQVITIKEVLEKYPLVEYLLRGKKHFKKIINPFFFTACFLLILTRIYAEVFKIFSSYIKQ